MATIRYKMGHLVLCELKMVRFEGGLRGIAVVGLGFAGTTVYVCKPPHLLASQQSFGFVFRLVSHI
jgi:hypothetical protein